jgi:hypothetical protein
VGEDVAWRVELPPPRHDRLADFRVAVLPAIPWVAVDAEISGALQEVATRLSRLGATVKEVLPDAFGDHRAHHQLYRSLLAAMTSARETVEGRQKRIAFWTQATDEFSQAHLRGLAGAPGDFVLWGAQREGFRQAWRAFFRDWDVLLVPAINVLAYPHVARPWPAEGDDLWLTLDVNGRAIPYLHGLVYPALSTVAGQPATAFPVGTSRGGLPIGLQAVGPYLEDLTPLRFAALLAREIGGFRSRQATTRASGARTSIERPERRAQRGLGPWDAWSSGDRHTGHASPLGREPPRSSESPASESRPASEPRSRRPITSRAAPSHTRTRRRGGHESRRRARRAATMRASAISSSAWSSFASVQTSR